MRRRSAFVGAIQVSEDFLREFSFRDVQATPERLSQAVELSTPERMRELEKREARHWAVTKSTRHDKPFVRSAVAGGWKSALSPESVALLETELGPLMRELGYLLTANTAIAEDSSTSVARAD